MGNRKATPSEIAYYLVGKPLAIGLIFYASLLGTDKLRAQEAGENNPNADTRAEQVVRNDGSGLENSVNEVNIPTKPQENINYRTEDFSKDSDEVLLARMLFGEARNCSDEEIIDVAYTAINRANDRKKWNGETLREAILKPWQYSCFNSGDPNLPKLKNPEKYDASSWKRCLRIAEGVLNDEYKDRNEGATHYFAENSRRPNWADSSQMTDISEPKEYKHDFYKEE